jgi:hypothetical protein
MYAHVFDGLSYVGAGPVVFLRLGGVVYEDTFPRLQGNGWMVDMEPPTCA